ncbi:uncharacterized protein DNG_04663 [Cephalotrichum gorgonifer]|uniref:PET hydrolase/cutinase-like domain-containing protein n=1 Tax=Cephalotrichum gorgonifer TaxID=2041049 RepID=A0AAE8MZ84_9PEZI|nr:uncharacterized protein DNG_04663 [Cephalotrichum gorgonifer]
MALRSSGNDARSFEKPCIAARSPLDRRQTFEPSPGNYPETGDDDFQGGIFGITIPDLDAFINRTGADVGYMGPESPTELGASNPGTGPYPAEMTTDPSLPDHTIYAPISAPNVTMPFIVWGNGACSTDGSLYQNFLLEIASHGYVIAADGPPGGLGDVMDGVFSRVSDMKASLDWVISGGASSYGDVDVERIAVAGQSCGGLEAMSTAYRDPRVKRILLFNIGVFQDEKRYLLDKIEIPFAWFVGGPGDLGYPSVEKDYEILKKRLPVLKANLDTGHGGTYAAENGGKFGTAAVAYLQWQFRGDARAKEVCLDPESEGSLVSENWTVESKNWC